MIPPSMSSAPSSPPPVPALAFQSAFPREAVIRGLGEYEAEQRHPGEPPDLGAGRLDQTVGSVVLDRGVDPGAVFDDALLQLHEHR